MIRVRTLTVKRLWRVEFCYCWKYFGVFWLRDWGKINARCDLGWTVHKRILEIGDTWE
jgi:hypothetical protein